MVQDVTSTVFDGQGYLVTSRERFSDTLIEWVEDIPWMDQRVETVELSDQDAAIESVVSSISGFQHRTIAGELSVRVN